MLDKLGMASVEISLRKDGLEYMLMSIIELIAVLINEAG
jgi:hypothetical protein